MSRVYIKTTGSTAFDRIPSWDCLGAWFEHPCRQRPRRNTSLARTRLSSCPPLAQMVASCMATTTTRPTRSSRASHTHTHMLFWMGLFVPRHVPQSRLLNQAWRSGVCDAVLSKRTTAAPQVVSPFSWQNNKGRWLQLLYA